MATAFNNAQLELGTTSTQTLYTAPTNGGSTATAVIMSILVANTSGSVSADITVVKQSSGSTEQARVAHIIPVPPNTSLELVPNRLVMKNGEILVASADGAGILSVILSAMEIT
jgi:hypothetical protein